MRVTQKLNAKLGYLFYLLVTGSNLNARKREEFLSLAATETTSDIILGMW